MGKVEQFRTIKLTIFLFNYNNKLIQACYMSMAYVQMVIQQQHCQKGQPTQD